MQATAAYIGNEQRHRHSCRKAQRLVNCRTLSRVICLCSVEQRIDTWAMRPTQKMRFRMRSSLLTNTWISSEGRRKCRRGWLPSSAIVRGCNCGEGHGRSTCRSTSNSGTNRGMTLSERLVHRGPSPEEEYRKAELYERLVQFAQELSPPLRRAFKLRDLDGLSTSEAAQTLGVVEGTVKAQVVRARAKLTRLVRRALDAKPRSSAPRMSLQVAEGK